jgi:small subunit ribosomal protein S1
MSTNETPEPTPDTSAPKQETEAVAPPPEATAAAAAPAASQEAEGDDGPEGPDGPDGPEGEDASASGDKKKRKRRRKKAKVEGPEGPPVEAAAAVAGPAAERPARPKRERGKGHGPAAHGQGANAPNRERTGFTLGEEVFGKVTSVLDEAIMVDLAGKALGIFDRSELAEGDEVPAVGDRFVAQVLTDGARGGFVVLTRKLLREEETKPLVEKAFQDKATVKGLVTGVIRGGIEVHIDGLRAFAPASHVDLRMGADLNHLIGSRLEFHVEQYAKRGRDVVVSRKRMLEGVAKATREASLAKLSVGATLKVIVRSVLAWGAFVSLPEADDIEGLVHVSELSHDPRAKLNDLLKVGSEIEVKLVKIDEKGKLWLSRKALEPDPFAGLREKYTVGSRHTGKVTKLQPFGAFVELEPGTEGLIHVADLSFKRIESPSEVVKEGQEIDVVVASFDNATKKIGLHPAVGGADEPRQKPVPGKMLKVCVVAAEASGVQVRILGATGRNARAFIPAGQTGTVRGSDLRKHFPPNMMLEAKVVAMEPKREPKLSIKALAEDTEKAAYNEYKSHVAKTAKFGTFADLLNKK